MKRISRVFPARVTAWALTVGVACAASTNGHERRTTIESASGGRNPAMPEPLHSFVASVEGLSSAAAADSRSLARIVRELANAMELLPNPHRPTSSEVRGAAEELAESTAESERRAALDRALTATLATLVVRTPPAGKQSEYHVAVDDFAAAVHALRAEGATASATLIRTAFRAAADAVLIAAGGEPPFGDDGAYARSSALGTLTTELEEARGDVLLLARSRSSRAPLISARALASLADVIAVAAKNRDTPRQNASVRFQAERLKLSDPLTFGRAQWIKAGLTSALDALDALKCIPASSERPSEAARRAVSSIDDNGSISFQRAPIQDGFRATIEAFDQALRATKACG